MDNYYQRNLDQFEGCENNSLSYNQVYDITEIEPSGDGPDEPVTLEEVKNFCKIDVSEDDDLITMMITACRQECESLTNIGFINRDVIVQQNNGNGGCYLPLGPNGTIDSVKNIEGTDLTHKIAGSTWKQVLEPRHERLVITYNTGYTTLPLELKLALLECIFFRYDERKVRENAHPPVYLDQLAKHSRIW